MSQTATTVPGSNPRSGCCGLQPPGCSWPLWVPAISYFTADPVLKAIFAIPDNTFWESLPRQIIFTWILSALLGLLVEKCGVNVALTRKATHITFIFVFPLLAMPEMINKQDLHHQWYLSAVWRTLLVFILPYMFFFRPIRTRIRFFYYGMRCFDRPEDRPYTLVWFVSQMMATGLIMIPMSQYFVHLDMWSLYLIPAAVNGLGDGLAEPIGKVYGKQKYKVRALFTRREYTRSYVGSACVAFFTTAGILANFSVLSLPQLCILLAVMPLLMTLIEAFSPHTWDNFFLYVASWIIIYLVLQV